MAAPLQRAELLMIRAKIIVLLVTCLLVVAGTAGHELAMAQGAMPGEMAMLDMHHAAGTFGCVVGKPCRAGTGSLAGKHSDMAILSYAVVLEPEAEGGFSVIIPALPEAHTQGETVDEGLANAREVIELVLESRLERGEAIPPSDVDGVRFERVSVSAPAA